MTTPEERLAIARARSTQEIIELDTQALQTEWITIDLVQDQSNIEKAPPIPGFVLTFLARKAFDSKIRSRIGAPRAAREYPRLAKMFFTSVNEEFNGVTASLTAHTLVQLQVVDLTAVIDWFVETMYHPSLGNKVFKIQIAKK